MQKFYQYVLQHLKSDFHAFYYLAVVACMLIALGLQVRFEFVNTWIRLCVFERQHAYFFAWLLFYATMYYLPLCLHAAFRRDWAWAKKPEFWLKSGTVIAAMSLYMTIGLSSYVARQFDTYPERFFTGRLAAIVSLTLLQLLPVALLYYLRDRQRGVAWLYGMSWKGFDWKAYLPLFLLAIPAIYLSAIQPHFREYYPICKPQIMAQLQLLNPKLAILLYETGYALTFVGVEVVFRGLLVVGMLQILGKNAVLPMVAFYFAVHFSKPLGEVLLSAPGGFILGILAHRTQNIIGGIWLHLTIALGMELFAAAG